MIVVSAESQRLVKVGLNLSLYTSLGSTHTELSKYKRIRRYRQGHKV